MARRADEKRVLECFIKSGVLSGLWDVEVAIPSKSARERFSGQDVFVHRLSAVHNFRVDAVCDVEGVIWLVEAKRVLNCKGLGQLLCYQQMYADWKGLRADDLRLMLVCGRAGSDLKVIYEMFDIEVCEVDVKCLKKKSSSSSVRK